MAEATETKSIKAQVEEMLICSMCLDVLENPKTLNCLHSYCKECLAKLKGKSPEKPGKADEMEEKGGKQTENDEGMHMYM